MPGMVSIVPPYHWNGGNDVLSLLKKDKKGVFSENYCASYTICTAHLLKGYGCWVFPAITQFEVCETGGVGGPLLLLSSDHLTPSLTTKACGPQHSQASTRVTTQRRRTLQQKTGLGHAEDLPHYPLAMTQRWRILLVANILMYWGKQVFAQPYGPTTWFIHNHSIQTSKHCFRTVKNVFISHSFAFLNNCVLSYPSINLPEVWMYARQIKCESGFIKDATLKEKYNRKT